jgi:hypothetical protein
VPGGQRYYIDPITSALSFTQAHSSSAPPNAIFGVEAYEGGEFVLGGTDGWMACPANPGARAPMPLGYQIFAQLYTVNSSFAPDCFKVSLLPVDYTGQGPAAWEYT